MSCYIPISTYEQFGQSSIAHLGVSALGYLIVDRNFNQTAFTVTQDNQGFFYISGMNGEATYALSGGPEMQQGLYFFAQRSAPGAFLVKFKYDGGTVDFYNATSGALIGKLAALPIGQPYVDPEASVALFGLAIEYAQMYLIMGFQVIALSTGLCAPPGLFAPTNGSLANGIVNSASNGSLANGNGIPKIQLPARLAVKGNGSFPAPTGGGRSGTIPGSGTVCYPITDKISVCYKN